MKHNLKKKFMKEVESCILWIREYFCKTDSISVILNLTHTIGSVATLILCSQALGKDKINAVIFNDMNEKEHNNLTSICDELKIKYITTNILDNDISDLKNINVPDDIITKSNSILKNYKKAALLNELSYKCGAALNKYLNNPNMTRSKIASTVSLTDKIYATENTYCELLGDFDPVLNFTDTELYEIVFKINDLKSVDIDEFKNNSSGNKLSDVDAYIRYGKLNSKNKNILNPFLTRQHLELMRSNEMINIASYDPHFKRIKFQELINIPFSISYEDANISLLRLEFVRNINIGNIIFKTNNTKECEPTIDFISNIRSSIKENPKLAISLGSDHTKGKDLSYKKIFNVKAYFFYDKDKNILWLNVADAHSLQAFFASNPYVFKHSNITLISDSEF